MNDATSGTAKLSTYQRWLFFFLGVAGFFEGYDIFALSQLLPAIRAEMGLATASEGLLVGFINTGAILAFFLVRRADRWGRRKALTVTILGYTLFSLLTGLAPNIWVFAVAQLCARFFLLAEWAIGIVYAAEEFPAARRGMVIGALNGLNGLGAVVCAGIASPVAASPLGWRGVYFIGAVPLLLMAIARRSLRETQRFTTQVEQGGATGSFARLLEPPWRSRTLFLAAIWWLTYACVANAITFWKEHAVQERGYTGSEVGLYISVAAVAAIPLTFLAGKLLDRLGRRMGAVLIYGSLVVGVLGCYMAEPRSVVVVCLVFGIAGVTAVATVLSAYNAELFPTALRGDAFGLSNNLLGRTAMVLSPFVAGHAAESFGWGRTVAATTVLPLVALVLLLVAMPETRGRELEETSAQPAS
ncbi:MFS transporter [Chondromyces crocatus]|uniref:MFS transporter permease n=1 Tax=Chondromyces crocatus TaxID=52 RepID=A0A0K1EQU5_CHOCO|nr:MFS transporter [Chondromyces crocatus]AKT42998.1 MFS transporter permease [Chondromyces crocatus]